MGNCCKRCRRKNDKRKYLRTRYSLVQEASVECENLVDEDLNPTDSATQYGSAMTDYERHLLSERKFHDLVQYQIKIDAEIEAQLLKQEEQLRKDDEAFFEAKRLAAKVASVKGGTSSSSAPGRHSTAGYVSSAWATGDDWDFATGEEDFDQFLENVKTKSVQPPEQSLPDDDEEWSPEFVSAE